MEHSIAMHNNQLLQFFIVVGKVGLLMIATVEREVGTGTAFPVGGVEVVGAGATSLVRGRGCWEGSEEN